jgi:hypothetical protein
MIATPFSGRMVARRNIDDLPTYPSVQQSMNFCIPLYRRVPVHLSCILASALLIAGCQRGPERVPVTGTVIYKKKPLEYGSIMFQPRSTEGAMTARSTIAADGSFALWTDKEGDGVAVGESLVRITAFEAQRAEAAGNQHQELALGRSAIPQHFQGFSSSGIVIDVTPDMELPITIDLDEFD